MTIKLKVKSLALFDLTIVFVQASLCLKRLQKGCSTVHNKSWQNCCQRCNSCQEFAVCQLLMKIDIVLLFKLPPCYVLCLPLTKRRHCFQFQNFCTFFHVWFLEPFPLPMLYRAVGVLSRRWIYGEQAVPVGTTHKHPIRIHPTPLEPIYIHIIGINKHTHSVDDFP